MIIIINHIFTRSTPTTPTTDRNIINRGIVKVTLVKQLSTILTNTDN